MAEQREGLLVLVQLGRKEEGLDLDRQVRDYIKHYGSSLLSVNTNSLGVIGYIGIVPEAGVDELRRMGVNAVYTHPLDPSFLQLPQEWDDEAKQVGEVIRGYQRLLTTYSGYHLNLAQGQRLNRQWKILNSYTTEQLDCFLLRNIVKQVDEELKRSRTKCGV